MTDIQFRTEKDTMGDVQVRNAYWGAQSERETQ